MNHLEEVGLANLEGNRSVSVASNECQWKKIPFLPTTLERLKERRKEEKEGRKEGRKKEKDSMKTVPGLAKIYSLIYILGCTLSQCKSFRKQFDRQSPNQ